GKLPWQRIAFLPLAICLQASLPQRLSRQNKANQPTPFLKQIQERSMNPIRTMLITITALTLFTLAGCSGEAGDAADTNTGKSAETSQETFTWKMVSTWSDTSSSGEYEQ